MSPAGRRSSPPAGAKASQGPLHYPACPPFLLVMWCHDVGAGGLADDAAGPGAENALRCRTTREGGGWLTRNRDHRVAKTADHGGGGSRIFRLRVPHLGPGENAPAKDRGGPKCREYPGGKNFTLPPATRQRANRARLASERLRAAGQDSRQPRRPCAGARGGYGRVGANAGRLRRSRYRVRRLAHLWPAR